jgi:hypothetical protein
MEARKQEGGKWKMNEKEAEGEKRWEGNGGK